MPYDAPVPRASFEEESTIRKYNVISTAAVPLWFVHTLESAAV
jgi:hypothetical protein